MARFALLPTDYGLGFLTLYPAIVLCFFICGMGPGALATVLGASVAYVAFIPPSWRLPHDTAGEIATLTFLCCSALIGLFSNLLHRADERLRALLASRHQIEIELRRSEQSLRLLVLDHVSGLICAVDRDLRYRFVNHAYADWFGAEPATLVGTTLPDFFGEAAYAGIAEDLRRALRGATVAAEQDVVAREGLRHCHVVIVPEHAPGGEVTGLFIVHTDITARRRSELALRASENLLARTGALARVGGWQIDLRDGGATWSDETCRLHDLPAGYRPQVAEALDYVAPHWRPVIVGALDACMKHGIPFDLELEMYSAKGRHFWAHATGTAEYENGKQVRVIGAFQDVTERRKIEQELANSNELLRVTLDSIGDAVITTDDQARVVWLNPVAQNITGWRKEETQGLPIAEVFRIVDAETRLPRESPVAACLRDRRISGLANHTVLVSRDGIEYHIEDSASPIRTADGKILGAVLVFHDVSEQRRLSNEMSHRATHDALTGLVNRTEFEMRLTRLLERAHRDASAHVLMYIDLDEFKVVNDSCGHAAGDQLLRKITALLDGSVRSRDTVARLGGDEFGLLLENCDMEQGQIIAQKICDQAELYRFEHDGKRYRIGTSIGVVPVDRRWQGMAAVLQAADSGCYAAKEAGRNRVHLWHDTDHTIRARQGEMQWVTRLEAALDEDRFTLAAQRIVPMQGSDPGLHCEVLLRLREPNGGIVRPGAFLPAAERFHMAARIDRWVVAHVFALLESPATDLDRITMIAINLSGQSIGDRALRRDLIKTIRAATFDVRKLCLEITETTAITNLGDAKAFFEEVRSLGVRVALDDFGAGASSFGYLRNLPVDYLKIDGQFIGGFLDDPLDNAAVRCFNEVAKIVGVKVIAEFVERTDVCAALQAIGIDMAQGYLIHRDEPLEQMLPIRDERRTA